MYKVKELAKRGSAFFAAAGFLGVAGIAALPQTTYADALNPLTERSLLLTSSAPGYVDTDGSGNSETIYSPPGSGPNGKKTGQTFSFRVSTDSTSRALKAMTFQYCTEAAGLCTAPGDNDGAAPTRDANGTDPNKSDLDVVYTSAVAGTDFTVSVNGVDQSTGWTLATSNVENGSGALTGKRNFITLKHASGITPTAGQQVIVKFLASTTQYITNPGSGHFFVKINTYDTDATNAQLPTTSANIIDGGVTVANVMTDSIHITTKVLETMSFSVGTVNPDNLDVDEGASERHGTCDTIETATSNRLQLGTSDNEFSLSTTRTYDAESFWRLSSNSSGGASVYYSGNTLANTVGDEIQQIGSTATISNEGTEQFGLALNLDQMAVAADFQAEVTNFAAEGYRLPALYSLTAGGEYDGGAGQIQEGEGGPYASFAFLKSSLTVPVEIASDDDEVVQCSTGRMRYIANIAPNTPAGVYTTKINYLAAPQY